MAILTQSGRAALAQAVKNQTMHVAWGTGDEAWDSEPIPEDTTQQFEIRGLKPNETITKIEFDGIDITPESGDEIIADDHGIAAGSFTVPAGIPSGTVLIRIEGDQGSTGIATYTGNGTITTESRRVVTTIHCYYDPLAQTFTLTEGRHVAGVDLWFKNKGNSRVLVQIRETTAGFPNQNVLAQASVYPVDININGTHTRVLFTPIWLDPNVEYAIVILTDDAETSVAVAELGKFDSIVSLAGLSIHGNRTHL